MCCGSLAGGKFEKIGCVSGLGRVSRWLGNGWFGGWKGGLEWVSL